MSTEAQVRHGIEGQTAVYYFTIDNITRKNARGDMLIHFRYATNNKASTHTYDIFKNATDHCYNQLEVGQTYIVVMTFMMLPGDGYGKWVWQKCKLIAPGHVHGMHRCIGTHNPTPEEFQRGLVWLKQMQHKTSAASTLSEELLKW